LLVARHLVVAHFHHELNVVFHDHVEEIYGCVALRCARSNDKLLFKAGIDPRCVDVIIEVLIGHERRRMRHRARDGLADWSTGVFLEDRNVIDRCVV
jgi:hypothetical protein